ncbi:pectate lyase [Sorangium sp. So ce1078]|uniref:pectate lyase n=1 Tax=Sorangium sp. So ce1078 TaxID=3133329 RepID=UPI003F61C3BD
MRHLEPWALSLTLLAAACSSGDDSRGDPGKTGAGGFSGGSASGGGEHVSVSSGSRGAGGSPGSGGAGAGGGSSGSGGGSSGSGGGTPGQPAEPAPCEPLAAGQRLAFPGAEGFGRLSSGGRGGDVCHVVNLDDSGPGSLRDCVSAGNRTVVFDVSGWITLSSNLGITQNNITIAGQTAPGGGVGVRGRKLSIGGDNIIVRFLRVRRGIVATTARDDAMTVSSTASDVIIDHCSIGFGTDENFSMPGDEAVGPRNLTVQWSIVAWGLARNNHSAGSLLTASNATIHHSVYAFNGTRNPKARSEDGRVLDFVNNVVYGWNAPDPYGESQGWSISKHPFIMADTANGMHYANAAGNYFISHGERTATQAFVSGATNADGVPTYNLYFDGNLLDGNGNGALDVSKDDWSMVGTATQLNERLPAPQVCTDDAPRAYERVMAGAGAVIPARDEVDALLVRHIGEQGGIKIQDESDLGVGADGYGALAPGAPVADTDRDGMPDAWETDRHLDPNGADDRNGDDDGDGYTNLEEYLNELAAPAFQ